MPEWRYLGDGILQDESGATFGPFGYGGTDAQQKSAAWAEASRIDAIFAANTTGPLRRQTPRVPQVTRASGKHGTAASYTNAGCRCPFCRIAAAHVLRQRAERRRNGEPTPHGTMQGYVAFGCRCSYCRMARALDGRKRRASNAR